jgi:ferredoxin
MAGPKMTLLDDRNGNQLAITEKSSLTLLFRQHLIDPEICIRCNTCEETCPVKAVTHDARNYVVDAAKCNYCNDCIAPCPTGAIDNWRQVDKARPYTLAEQFGWDSLPAQCELAAGATPELPSEVARITGVASAGQGGDAPPPWSAAHPYVNLYLPANPATATVSGNFRLTGDGASSDIRHLVLDFGGAAFPSSKARPSASFRPTRRAAASRAPVFGREPPRGRTPEVQQPRADREAGDRGP